MDEPPGPLTITAIRAAARGRQRVIELSDGREFMFSTEAVERAGGLTEDAVITEEVLQSLDAAEVRVNAHEAALRLLAHRARSAKEMKTRLGMRGFPPDAIEAEIERLHAAGLLDDSKFAVAWVEDRKRLAPRGRRMLRYELLGRGIDSEAAEKATEGIDDHDLARNLALQRARRAPRESYEAFAAKVSGFLRRRGFDYDVAASATRAAWEHQQAEESERNGAARPESETS